MTIPSAFTGTIWSPDLSVIHLQYFVWQIRFRNQYFSLLIHCFAIQFVYCLHIYKYVENNCIICFLKINMFFPLPIQMFLKNWVINFVSKTVIVLINIKQDIELSMTPTVSDLWWQKYTDAICTNRRTLITNVSYGNTFPSFILKWALFLLKR